MNSHGQGANLRAYVSEGKASVGYFEVTFHFIRNSGNKGKCLDSDTMMTGSSGQTHPTPNTVLQDHLFWPSVRFAGVMVIVMGCTTPWHVLSIMLAVSVRPLENAVQCLAENSM